MCVVCCVVRDWCCGSISYCVGICCRECSWLSVRRMLRSGDFMKCMVQRWDSNFNWINEQFSKAHGSQYHELVQNMFMDHNTPIYDLPMYPWRRFTNPLQPELSDNCTLQKTQDLNDYLLLCMFLANNFSISLLLSESQCILSTAESCERRLIK